MTGHSTSQRCPSITQSGLCPSLFHPPVWTTSWPSGSASKTLVNAISQVCPSRSSDLEEADSTHAETEKYAHVTFFFNGGVEKQFPKEERAMIPSPKVATYDKQPEMSVQAVADKVAEVVKSNKYGFVMCNFAPPDMVWLLRHHYSTQG